MLSELVLVVVVLVLVLQQYYSSPGSLTSLAIAPVNLSVKYIQVEQTLKRKKSCSPQEKGST